MVSNQVIRMEEEILNLLPCEETLVYEGCIVKTIGHAVWVCPLYGLSNEKDQIEKSEQYARIKCAACSFRILDGTHYALRYRLLENGYQETGRFLIGAFWFTEENREEKSAYPEKSRFSAGQGDKGSRTVIKSRDKRSVGLLGADCLFLPDGERCGKDLPGILGFSAEKGLSQVLVSFTRREDLPEDYRKAGFVKAYTYRCYQRVGGIDK